MSVSHHKVVPLSPFFAPYPLTVIQPLQVRLRVAKSLLHHQGREGAKSGIGVEVAPVLEHLEALLALFPDEGLMVAETHPLEKINFHLSRIGDFIVLQEPPHDFGGVAISHPCSGMVLFAGSVIWMGRGRQLHPTDPIPPETLQHTSEEVPAPQRIDVWSLGGALEDDAGGLAAWDVVRDLKLVRDLAAAPYSVLVYLYPRAVGAFDPDNADWGILVQRGPTR